MLREQTLLCCQLSFSLECRLFLRLALLGHPTTVPPENAWELLFSCYQLTIPGSRSLLLPPLSQKKENTRDITDQITQWLGQENLAPSSLASAAACRGYKLWAQKVTDLLLPLGSTAWSQSQSSLSYPSLPPGTGKCHLYPSPRDWSNN